MWFDIRGDLRTAIRMVLRNPGTSTLIVMTLALAIGAATIGFTFADLALFRGLPVDDNSRSCRSSPPTPMARRSERASRRRTSWTIAPGRRRSRPVGDARRPRAADQERPVTDTHSDLRHRESVSRDGTISVQGRVFAEGDDCPALYRWQCCRIITGGMRWRAGPTRSAGRCRSGARSSPSSAC